MYHASLKFDVTFTKDLYSILCESFIMSSVSLLHWLFCWNRWPGTTLGHIIHSKLSVQPREVLLNEKDFNYGAQTHLAMTPLEHIGHMQSGNTFVDVWTHFREATDAVHGDPANHLPNPILLNTNCVGQPQNG